MLEYLYTLQLFCLQVILVNTKYLTSVLLKLTCRLEDLVQLLVAITASCCFQTALGIVVWFKVWNLGLFLCEKIEGEVVSLRSTSVCKFQALFLRTKGNSNSPIQFPISQQAGIFSRQPMQYLSKDSERYIPANVTVLSPEEEKQKANIPVSLLVCFQPKDRVESPVQIGSEQGSCRE